MIERASPQPSCSPLPLRLFRARVGLVLAGAIVLASPASAVSPEAEVLLERGTELRKQGDDRRALAAFEQAWALDHSAQALAQWALAEQALGRWLEAARHLREALQQAEEPWIRLHRATLEAAQREMVSQIGRVEISCNVVGVEVYVDGRTVGRTPLEAAVPVIAGQSVIQLSAKGYFGAVRRVQVDAGSLSRVDVTLVAEPPAAGVLADPAAHSVARSVARSVPDPVSKPGGDVREMVLYGSLGLGALGLSVGAAGYWVREANVRVYNDDSQCARQPGVPRSRECAREASAWHLGEAAAIAGFSAGAVFGALGIYLWLKPAGAHSAGDQACVVGPSSLSCGGSF